jgi:hypothetical protein
MQRCGPSEAVGYVHGIRLVRCGSAINSRSTTPTQMRPYVPRKRATLFTGSADARTVGMILIESSDMPTGGRRQRTLGRSARPPTDAQPASTRIPRIALE